MSSCHKSNEFNEKNVAADNPNSLASVVTQEIHIDNKADNFGCVWITDVIQQYLHHSSTSFRVFVQSHRALRVHLYWPIGQLSILFFIINSCLYHIMILLHVTIYISLYWYNMAALHSCLKLFKYHILLIICSENLYCSTSLPSFPKNVRDYQLLQAFIAFTCKNLPKNIWGCEVIHKKCESFSPWMINNI